MAAMEISKRIDAIFSIGENVTIVKAINLSRSFATNLALRRSTYLDSKSQRHLKTVSRGSKGTISQVPLSLRPIIPLIIA